jgi:tetratricopeptide (TPR) repeat protein
VVEPEAPVLDLLRQIEQLQQNPEQNLPQLARLFEQLGQVYAGRDQSAKNRQFAIQVYQRAIQLQRQLGHQAELADSLKKLGDLYFELRDNVQQASKAYDEALRLFREVGDRLGEANTLTAIGDVLQFLDQRQAALSRYDEALRLFREVGSRLGEANALLGLGSLRENPAEALAYFLETQQISTEIGDQYSQDRNLLWYVIPAQQQLGDLEGAQHSLDTAAALGDAIGLESFRQRAEQLRTEMEQPPGTP